MLCAPGARFDLACRLREAAGVPLGEVFSFLSGLYFRGKLSYARAFARPPARVAGAWIITTNRGLVEADQPVTVRELKAFSTTEIDHEDLSYRRPLVQSAESLAKTLGSDCQVVLLGSIATGKYCELLLETFGERLVFPAEFIGRGDMSRGGLLLRCVLEERELSYLPVLGARRHGGRPPKLKPLRGIKIMSEVSGR